MKETKALRNTFTSVMRRYFLLIALLYTFSIGLSWPTRAQNLLREVQFQNSSLVGTWRSGNFAYTFSRNGTYVYVGAIVTPGMETKTAENGTYTVNGDKLIIQRESGIIVTSMNYRQDLEPATTIYRWRLGNTQIGRTLRLIFPDGRPQDFYLSE
jgi:FtsP/CotA-like multicopper oxidase with cupredoxin domain